MIKVNKARITMNGELTVVAAEYMTLTAYMAETFGTVDVLNMVEGVIEEMEGGANDK